jgi:hypothetical protein
MGYQEQVTGIQRTADGHVPEYHVPNTETGDVVAFDGHTYRGDDGREEVFLESKRGYALLKFRPDLRKVERMAERLLDEAERQLDALPDDARLEWHVSDPDGEEAIRKLFAQGDIEGIDLIYTPEV